MSNIYPTAPGRLDFGGRRGLAMPMRQGSTFTRLFTVENLDLTGHEIRCSIREEHEDAEPLVYLSTGNGRISILGSDSFSMILPAALTETLPAAPGQGRKFIYDVEVVDPSGRVYPLLEGRIYITAEVTKEDDSS